MEQAKLEFSQEDCDKISNGIMEDDKKKKEERIKRLRKMNNVLEILSFILGGIAFIINLIGKNYSACVWVIIAMMWLWSARESNKFSKYLMDMLDEIFALTDMERRLHKSMSDNYEKVIEKQKDEITKLEDEKKNVRT